MSDATLPPGSHYAVTWGIGEQYAGMTSALLHRSRAFVRLGGAAVTVLTYEFVDDLERQRRSLRERGDVVDGITVRNLWEDLRGWSTEELAVAAGSCTATVPSSWRPLESGDASLRSIRREDDAVLQVDYRREDGTLLLSDLRAHGDEPRSVVLCDRSGEPLAAWPGTRGLYVAWLDSLPREPVAYFVVDSKVSADHVTHYRRDDAVTVYVVHGSHLLPGEPPTGELKPDRRYALERESSWDALVLLTEQQRADVEHRFGPASHRHVCPNGRVLPARPPALDRDPAAGAMVASLRKRKRVEQAVQAVAAATDRSRWRRRSSRPRLDVYGDGPRRRAIERQLATVPFADVTLHGYVDDVDRRLQEASFSVLTSISEGQPLAVIESMAAGCIPIAYDIRYGSADLITHGVNGFLVPDGDVEELARTIRRVVTAPQHELRSLRQAALRRAQDFDDHAVTARWAEIMRAATAKQDA